jgi:pimeloyl-ACP methyl ester carboxylesterase
MTWHGQINRTIWEIQSQLERQPKNLKLRSELVRTHFLQRYEYDRSLHIPRDDRSFLFLQEDNAPAMLLIHGAQGTPAELREKLHPVHSLILLAPAIHIRMGIKERLYTVMRHVTPTLFYRIAGWNGEVVKAMDHLRGSTREIRTPTLVLQARDDHIISSRGLNTMKKWLGKRDPSEVVLLPNGSHAITRGKAKEEVFDRIYDFTQKTKSRPDHRSI